MKFLIFDPNEQAEETRQKIEQIERTWHELSANEHNDGTAKRMAELEAEHEALAPTLPPSTTPLEAAVDAQIQEIKSIQIQSQVAAALEPLKDEEGNINCDAAIAKLERLKRSTSDAKDDGGHDE